MFVDVQLEQLDLRRKALIAQSELQRAVLQLECIRLQPYIERVDTGVGIFNKARSFWMVAAPALGAVFATQWRKAATWVPSGLVAWRTVRRLWSLWKRHKKQSAVEQT